MLTMSVIATIGAGIIDNNGNTKIGFALIGPAMWATIGFCVLIDWLGTVYREWNLRAIMVDSNGNYFYCKSRDAKWFEECEDERYKFASFDKEKFNPLDWDKHNQIMGVGNQRYSPRKVWSKFQPIPKSELKYAKEHPYKKEC